VIFSIPTAGSFKIGIANVSISGESSEDDQIVLGEEEGKGMICDGNKKALKQIGIDCCRAMSERRGSNPRPRPWQGRALPTELLSHGISKLSKERFLFP
jgi:hypothetical protein